MLIAFVLFLFVSLPVEAVVFKPSQITLHDELTAGFGIVQQWRRLRALRAKPLKRLKEVSLPVPREGITLYAAPEKAELNPIGSEQS
jgi:hypothetical protein